MLDANKINQKVESYKQGYPQFSALLSAHDPFFLCLRFSRLRARILLLKQDKLVLLENKLDRIDQEEQWLLFLSLPWEKQEWCEYRPHKPSI